MGAWVPACAGMTEKGAGTTGWGVGNDGVGRRSGGMERKNDGRGAKATREREVRTGASWAAG